MLLENETSKLFVGTLDHMANIKKNE
jgi:hypothetical protein